MKKARKARVEKKFLKYKPPILFTFIKKVCTDMLSKPLIFTDPRVPYADLLLKVDNTTISFNEHKKGTPPDTLNFYKDYADLLLAIETQANYVDYIAQGNVIIIMDSGFNVVLYHNKITKHDSTYKQGASGEIINVLRKIKGAYCYVFQYCLFVEGEEPVWILADVTKKAKYTYKGLKPGGVYLFRYSPGVDNTLQVWSRPHKMIVT